MRSLAFTPESTLSGKKKKKTNSFIVLLNGSSWVLKNEKKSKQKQYKTKTPQPPNPDLPNITGIYLKTTPQAQCST